MERATETDAEQLLMCLCAFIDVSNEGCCEIINTPPLWKVIEEFANSFDSRRVFVAYCFLGNLTFKLTDMMPIAKILKGSVIRFQLGSVDANACNKIIWTLSNILADDTFGRLLFEDICNTKMFIETLLEALHLHIKAGKPMNGDILVCLVHLGDGHFLELLLNKYKVLTIVEILLERTNSKSSLESGLTILWALLEKGAIEFCPKVNSENPTVVVLTKEDDLCNLLTSLFKTPFKSVHTLLQKIYEDYLPYDC
jgi:hypothetical protein